MSGLTRLALANRAVVVLATLVVIGVGLFMTTALRQELIPSLTNPSASVVATYPGAAPQAVESQVTEPLETALKGVTGVTKVTSTSGTNVTQLTATWDFGADNSEMESKIRTAVDGARSNLPTGVDPQVIVGSFADVPVIFLAVSSDLPPEQLAAKLKSIAVPKLSGLDGVRSADLSGEQVKQVVITTRQADLDRLGVDPSQLQQLVPTYKAAIPAGDISEAGQDQSVQIGHPLATLADVQNLQLQGKDGPVPLSAVADVVDAPVPVTTISRVNGHPSLDLSVTKSADANTVTVAKEVRDALPDLTKQVGGNTKFETIFDQAPFIEQSIHDLTVEGGLGLVMAVLVILVFLWSVRPTLITAISIPLSLLITLISLYLMDYTLNLLTLSALTVAVGRVVDDSIVVIENIERHLHAGEKFSLGTIVNAVKQVAGAVTASTLTTVAVFAPITLVSGEAGELFRPFGLTVTVALLASLFVALTIVPALASWFMRPSRKPVSEAKLAREQASADKLAAAEDVRHQREYDRAAARLAKKEAKTVAWLQRHDADEATIAAQVAQLRERNPMPVRNTQHFSHESAQTRLQRGYLPVLRTALRHPLITIALAVVLFLGTMGMTSLLKTDFIGDAGQTSLSVSQTLPSGASLEATDAANKKVEAVLAKEPSVETYQTTVGGGGLQSQFTGGVGSSNKATTSVTLKTDSKGADVATRLRSEFGKLKDAGTVEVVTSDGSTGTQSIDIALKGTDEAALAQAGQQVEKMMNELPGFRSVTSDLADQSTVLQVNVNEAAAAKYGMSQATVGAAANEALKGATIGTMTIDGVDRDIVLRSRAPLTTKAQLEALPLPVTQKQTGDAQKAAADQLTADSKTQQDQQLADQRSELTKSETQLRQQRTQASQQLAALNAQLAQLKAAPLPPPQPLPTVSNPGAQVATQIAELQSAIGQLQKSVSALNDQLASVQQSRDKLNDQAAQSAATQAKSDAAKNVTGSPIALSSVATVVAQPAPATITREDGARTVTVSGVPGGDLRTATAAVQKGLDDLKLPAGVTATLGGVSQQQGDAFTQLFLAMAIAIAIVYMVMVATFRSLVQPLILLVSVPFAATGAILLLLTTSTPLGLPSMIGLLMLIGIVVTNAIVLIDLVNTFRRDGASIDDAVIHGARLRLRPIIMTALATVMALIPMGLGLTGGGVFISKPLAIVVIGGLISSTLLTLVLVPVLYHLVERGKERFAGWRRRRREDPVVDPDEELDDLDNVLGPQTATVDGFE